jgi:hypothetical protein
LILSKNRSIVVRLTTPQEEYMTDSIPAIEDCKFYHAMDLPQIGFVQGAWDLRGRFDDYIGGVGLKDRSVLDVGTASGFLSFEAEQRGAQPVTSSMRRHIASCNATPGSQAAKRISRRTSTVTGLLIIF